VNPPDLIILRVQFQHSPELFPWRGKDALHRKMCHAISVAT
jgi:hypothetical protein